MRVSLEGPWLHVPGEPVAFHRGLAEKRGGEGNLTDKFHDRHYHWAKTYEDFFTGDGGPLATSSRCQRGMARRWREAGSQLYRHRAFADALVCFRKSRGWYSWQISCYLWMLRAWLATFTWHSAHSTKITPNPANQRSVSTRRERPGRHDSKNAVARP
jgi:hypothetical protein